MDAISDDKALFGSSGAKEADCFYPKELANAERELVAQRRRINGQHLPVISDGEPNNYVGLALSGGGIRSATSCLGICQFLASAGLLSRVDFLSTVSGGGFFGGFLGAWIHRTGMANVSEQLPKNDDRAIRFLRENGRYIAPNGSGDVGAAVASYARGWIAVLATLGLLLFGLFLVATAAQETLVAYLPAPWRPSLPFWRHAGALLWLSPWWLAPYAILILCTLPLMGAFWLLGEKPLRVTPAVWLFILLICAILVWCRITAPSRFPEMFVEDARGLGGVIALMFAAIFCETARKAANTVARSVRGVLAVGCGLLAYLSFNGPHLPIPLDQRLFSPDLVLRQANELGGFQMKIDPFQSRLMLLCVTILGSVWVVTFAWAAVSNNVDLARRKLTEFTALSLWFVAGLSLFAFIDTLGGTGFNFLANRTGLAPHAFAKRLIQIGPMLATACATAQKWLRSFFAPSRSQRPPTQLISLMVSLASAVLAIACLASLSLAVHAVARGQDAVMAGAFTPFPSQSSSATMLWILAGLLLVLSCFVGHTKTLLNMSSDLGIYTARLTRAYLGATNPHRQDVASRTNVTQPDREDDLPFTEYHPEKRGGPLHLINVTVNETISAQSNLEQRDRRGFSIALGPVGISAGRTGHAYFADETGTLTRRLARLFPRHGEKIASMGKFVALRWKRNHTIVTPKCSDFNPNPLAQNSRQISEHRVEMPTLGEWMAISGAAFSTGLGQRTSYSFSFLAGLFNVRLGYWWDSAISPFRRRPSPLGLMEWLGLGASTVFPAQSYLLDEFLARFHGPAARQFWNLTDGGHFENTAVYELVRRRVHFIILCDCGADNGFVFDDAANLVRKARIDFDTEIRFMDAQAIKTFVAPEIVPYFGALGDFGANQDEMASPQAALADVYYPDNSRGLLLLLKPTLRGDEPLDIQRYHANNMTFPQESTLDQFFNEAQWESYRCLGRLIAQRVFGQSAPGKWSPLGEMSSHGAHTG